MKKNTCRAIVSAVLTACLGIGLAACAMQTETNETGVNETNSTLTQETDPVASSTAAPEEITVPESVISVDTSKLSKARTLKVGVDNSVAVITITNKDNEVVDELTASDCADRDEDYYVCTFQLPAGEYNVGFSPVSRFESPDDVPVNLKWGGTKVYGSYAEDPAAREPARPSLGLPGLVEPLAF